MPVPHVVIIGGGFGGLAAARALKHAPVRITIIDRRNHHLFQPLLYQVATAALAAPDIAAPIRRVLRAQRNVTVILAEARRITAAEREVILDEGTVRFDALIVATGATHAYFDHEEWASFAPGLKTIEDAFEIRRCILVAFETAERATAPEVRKPCLTFAIVGAGPTGVELAGALQEIAQRTLARDFRNFDPRETRVILIDGADRVLSTFAPELSAAAERLLVARGVEVRKGCQVTHIDAEGVTAGNERIEARTVLWAAGVKASPLGASLGAPLDRQGRVLVQNDLSIEGHPNVFVIGDLAAMQHDGAWLPGLAPAAVQEGRHVAENVVRHLRGEPTVPFRYKHEGLLATIGRAAAVADLRGFRFSGLIAWLVWLFVHIMRLVGFRNRIVVLVDWARAYFTYERSARVILDRPAVPRSTREKNPGD